MNCDSAFCIGKTHKVCQDYAISHMDNEGNATVVLSDGCSGSPDTDIGARMLAMSTLKFLIASHTTNKVSPDGRSGHFIIAARYAMGTISRFELLSKESMDATLLTLDVCGERMVFNAWGDGILSFGFEDGSIISYVISYPSGYPHYISYEVGPKDRKKGFDELDEGARITILSTNKEYAEVPLEVKTPFGIKFDIPFLDECYGKTKFIAIMSDGISSFYEHKREETFTNNTPIPELDVLKELLNFKGFNGQFVSRRLKRFMKDCAKKNWEHADDVSLAVIALD